MMMMILLVPVLIAVGFVEQCRFVGGKNECQQPIFLEKMAVLLLHSFPWGKNSDA